MCTCCLCDPRCGTKQVETIACRRTTLSQRWQCIGAGDTLRHRLPHKACSPYDTYAIRQDERGLIDGYTKIRVVLRRHHELRVDGDDLLTWRLIVTRTTPGNDLFNAVKCLLL